MKNTVNLSHPFEPTIDELPAGSGFQFALDRRKFFQITGGGLAVAVAIREIFSTSGKTAVSGTGDVAESGVAAWIHIGEDGKVTVYTGKVEVGQNIRTSLSQQISEELMVSIA